MSSNDPETPSASSRRAPHQLRNMPSRPPVAGGGWQPSRDSGRRGPAAGAGRRPAPRTALRSPDASVAAQDRIVGISCYKSGLFPPKGPVVKCFPAHRRRRPRRSPLLNPGLVPRDRPARSMPGRASNPQKVLPHVQGSKRFQTQENVLGLPFRLKKETNQDGKTHKIQMIQELNGAFSLKW